MKKSNKKNVKAISIRDLKTKKSVKAGGSAAPNLMAQCATGKHINTATLAMK